MSRPLPTAVKEARGSYNRHPERRTNGEPEPFGKPIKPRHLDSIASKEWTRITGLLSKMGVLSASDAPSLEQHCCAYSNWRKALARIDQGGETEEGRTYSAAAVREAREAADQVRRYLIEFGMTPASRTRVRAETAAAEVDWFTEAIKKRASN
jgi:P27 family predicted phage terminase small subunit